MRAADRKRERRLYMPPEEFEAFAFDRLFTTAVTIHCIENRVELPKMLLEGARGLATRWLPPEYVIKQSSTPCNDMFFKLLRLGIAVGHWVRTVPEACREDTPTALSDEEISRAFNEWIGLHNWSRERSIGMTSSLLHAGNLAIQKYNGHPNARVYQHMMGMAVYKLGLTLSLQEPLNWKF